MRSRSDRTERSLADQLDQAGRDARRAIESDVMIVDARRLILRSPDGHFWAFSVTNAGALVTTDLGTVPPG